MWVCAGAAQNECSKSPSPGTHSALRSAKAEPMARVTGSRVETPGPELRSHRLHSLKGQPRRGLPARCQGASGSSKVRCGPAAAVPRKIEGPRNCQMRPKQRASRNRGLRFFKQEARSKERQRGFLWPPAESWLYNQRARSRWSSSVPSVMSSGDVQLVRPVADHWVFPEIR